MKTTSILSKSVAALLMCCFPALLFSQTNCQSILPKISFSEPAIVPADTGWIDLCLGDTLTLTGSGIYPQNNARYAQSDSTSSFTWLMGDGNRRLGKTIQYVYKRPGAFYLQLIITDAQGCKNDSSVLQRIRVAPKPDVQFVNDENEHWLFCKEDTIEVMAILPQPDTLTFTTVSTIVDKFLIDHKTGSYKNPIIVDEYPENRVMTSPDDLQRICLNIEHSWARDLEIAIICPNGQKAILHNLDPDGRTGTEIILGNTIDKDDGVPMPGVGSDFCWTMNSTVGTWLEIAALYQDDIILLSADYTPFQPFDSLVGCPINGEWTLEVKDFLQLDNGFIFGWSIEFSESVFGDEKPESFISKIEDFQWLPNEAIIQNINDTLLVAIQDSIAPLMVETTDNFGCVFQQEQAITTYPEGHPFCQPCDSLQIFITGDTLSCRDTNVLRASANLPDSIVRYRWLDAQGNVLGTSDTFNYDNKIPYLLEVTNFISGCTKKDTIDIILETPLPTLVIGEVPSICRGDTVLLDGSFSQTGEHIRYLWSGPSIIGDSTANKIWVDSAGIYTFTVLDTLTGCINQTDVAVSALIAFEVTTVPAACDTASGKAAIQLQSEGIDYTVSWSTGETGDSIQNLAQGWYSVTVTGNECTIHQNFYVDKDRSCKVTISGYVYTNGDDCARTPLTYGIPGIMLHLMPADIYTYTAINGFYEFVADPGNYTVKYVGNEDWILDCPQDSTFTFSLLENGAMVRDSHFYVRRRPDINLKVSASIGPTRPGFETQIHLKVCNAGDHPMDATLQFTHDHFLTDITLSQTASSYNRTSKTALWELRNLGVGECRTFSFRMRVDRDVPLSKLLENVATVTPFENDIQPDNNRFELRQQVTGAYDPNDKQLLNAKNTFGGPIFEQDSILHYQIRFQNTGTDTAFTVVIRDTIDANLQVESIRPGIASHDYSLEFESKNVLIFRFENILLPDSTRNEPASHGFTTYSIKTRPGLTLGDTVRNTAAIYFDYNKPVITNTVENILTQTTSVWKVGKQGAALKLSPNPTAGALSIEWNMPYASTTRLMLSNANGQMVKKIGAPQRYIAGEHRLNINLDDLEPGVYFLILETEQERITEKVVKLK